MLKCDFHCHTTESDGLLTPQELVAEYEAQGFDVLAVTDHDKFTKVHSDRLLIVPGTEFTYKDDPTWKEHILFLFIEEMPKDAEDAQNALIYAAHPGTWRGAPDTFPTGIFGVEAVNWLYTDRVKSFMAYLEKRRWRDWLRIYNSDAHKREHIGQVYTLLDAEKTLEGVKLALLTGKTRLGGIKLGCTAAPLGLIGG